MDKYPTPRNTDTYHVSHSERFDNGEILITTYTRVGDEISVTMDLYHDPLLKTRTRYLGMSMTNGSKVFDENITT